MPRRSTVEPALPTNEPDVTDGSGRPARVPKLSRRAILQEAARLFRAQGYENTSLDQLADIFGVTRQALYYHYSSKEDVLWDINLIACQLHEVEEDILEQNLAPLQILKSFFWNFSHVTAVHPDVSWSFYQEGRSLSPERAAAMVNRRREFTSRVEAVYRDAAREGLVVDQDPKLMSFLMLGTISWIPRWYRSGAWSPEQVADTVSDMLVSGVLTAKGRSVYRNQAALKWSTGRSVVFGPSRRRGSKRSAAASA